MNRPSWYPGVKTRAILVLVVFLIFPVQLLRAGPVEEKQDKLKKIEEKLEAAKKHIGYIEKYRDMEAKSKVGYMRKVAQWYAKGHPYTNRIRRI
jgi:tRNA-dihydrouridine synthase